MARQQLSLKQLSIDKDNSMIVIVVGLAVFVIIFSLVASNALIKQSAYQSRVINKKKIALEQVKSDVNEIEKLKTSYQAFADAQQNVLGGSATGTGERDGDNSRLVLDALPSKYDFPALTTSLEKVFKSYGIDTITGTDDEVAQAEAEAAITPAPVEMPYTISLTANSTNVKDVLTNFERSIRPMQLQKMSITGKPDQLSVNVDAKTFFQPAVKFDVKQEPVK